MIKLLDRAMGWSNLTDSILPAFGSSQLNENHIGNIEFGYFKKPANVIKLYIAVMGGGATNGNKKHISFIDTEDTVLLTVTLGSVYPYNESNTNRFLIIDISSIPSDAIFSIRFEDNDDNSLGQNWAWLGVAPCSFMYSEV